MENFKHSERPCLKRIYNRVPREVLFWPLHAQSPTPHKNINNLKREMVQWLIALAALLEDSSSNCSISISCLPTTVTHPKESMSLAIWTHMHIPTHIYVIKIKYIAERENKFALKEVMFPSKCATLISLVIKLHELGYYRPEFYSTQRKRNSLLLKQFLPYSSLLSSNDNLASASREAQTTEDVWMWYSDQLLAVKSGTFGVFPNYCSSIS